MKGAGLVENTIWGSLNALLFTIFMTVSFNVGTGLNVDPFQTQN